MITKNIIKVGLVGLLALLLMVLPLIGACAPEEPEEFTLKITAIGEGTTSPAPGTSTITEGESVTVTATPNPGYEFSYWAGDVSGTTSPITFKMTSDKSAVAVFTEVVVGKPMTVKVGYLGDLTGPYAAVGAPLVEGWTDYLALVNERGGIDGVPLEGLWADTRADAALTVAAYKRFKAAGALTVSCMVTPVALAVQALLEEDKLPGINQAATMLLYFPPQDYMWCHGGVNTDYELTCLYYFDTEVWDRDKWGPWTLGILAHDNPFTLGGISGMYKYCDTHDITLVKPEVVAYKTLDFSTNIMRLVDAGADVIMIDSLGADSGVILKQMGELGVLGTVEEAATVEGKIVPFLGYTSYYVSAIQAGIEYAPYTYGARGYAADWEEEYLGVKECNDFQRGKYGRILEPVKGGTVYREGWHNAMVMVAAIERALEAVGWERLNGETLMEYGLKGLTFDSRGLSAGTGYADYEGDRINIQSFALAAWDEERGGLASITPYLNVPEVLPECQVTDYMTVQGDPTWFTP